jgi:glycosyltransferase involved in cell wall biosynthesis
MRHALFVAFHYPPEASSSGVLRTLKYTRYLPDHGWRVTVLTLRTDAYETTDPVLAAQIPESVRVVRSRYVDVKRHLAFRGLHSALLAIPDRWIGWWPWAVAAGRRILREDPVDLVYSTSPHPTAHLIAGALARMRSLPWVADFRDPWFEDPPEPGTPALAHWAARRLEGAVVHRANRVIASTARLRDTLAARWAAEPAEKFASISNGYDDADFSGLASAPPRGREQPMLLLHAGSINPLFRDPRPLLEAIRDAADMGLLDTSRIRLRFLGGGPFGDSPEMQRLVAGTRLASRVEFHPRVLYDAALSELRAADVVVLLQASTDTLDLVPAKLFEYLGAGRPVLALVYPGATGEVLQETGGGWAVDPRDRAALREAVMTVYRAWCAGTLDQVRAAPERLARFSRRHLAAQLAGQFDSLAGAAPRATASTTTRGRSVGS